MSPRTLVVANPRSRAGATGRRLERIAARLREALGEIEVELTRGPRDAERIAREGVRAGVERLVVAGGDGTLSEVATGLLAAQLGGYAEIGLLPLGTGGDFARSLGVPRGLDDAVAVLASGKARPVDAARLHFRGPDGRERTSYSVNVTSLGIGGRVVELVNAGPKWLGGRLAFLLATVRALARWSSPPARVRVDGRLVWEGPLLLGVAANGGFFGGGMHIAPHARLDDGLLDVVVVRDRGRVELARKLPRLYAGTHLDDPAVAFVRGRVLEAEAEPGRVPIDVDGEALGGLPLRVEVLPGALSFVAPARPPAGPAA